MSGEDLTPEEFARQMAERLRAFVVGRGAPPELSITVAARDVENGRSKLVNYAMEADGLPAVRGVVRQRRCCYVHAALDATNATRTISEQLREAGYIAECEP